MSAVSPGDSFNKRGASVGAEKEMPTDEKTSFATSGDQKNGDVCDLGGSSRPTVELPRDCPNGPPGGRPRRVIPDNIPDIEIEEIPSVSSSSLSSHDTKTGRSCESTVEDLEAAARPSSKGRKWRPKVPPRPKEKREKEPASGPVGDQKPPPPPRRQPVRKVRVGKAAHLEDAFKDLQDQVDGQNIAAAERAREQKERKAAEKEQEQLHAKEVIGRGRPDMFVNRTGGFANSCMAPFDVGAPTVIGRSNVILLWCRQLYSIMCDGNHRPELYDPRENGQNGLQFMRYNARDHGLFHAEFQSPDAWIGGVFWVMITYTIMAWYTNMMGFLPQTTAWVYLAWSIYVGACVRQVLVFVWRYNHGDVCAEYLYMGQSADGKDPSSSRLPADRTVDNDDDPDLMLYRCRAVYAHDQRTVKMKAFNLINPVAFLVQMIMVNYFFLLKGTERKVAISWRLACHLITKCTVASGLAFPDLVTKCKREALAYSELSLRTGPMTDPTMGGQAGDVRTETALFAAHYIWSATAYIPVSKNGESTTLPY